MPRTARRAKGRGLDARQIAIVHRVAGIVLDYPGEDLIARIPDLRIAVAAVPDPARSALEGVLDHLERTALTQLTVDYVEGFDMRRRACLYLTYYGHGDTRQRGVALLSFKQAYRAAGLELTDEELPDHLCVLLEFSATQDAEVGTRLLLEHRAGLEVLRLALLDAGSPYAGALVAVCATLPALVGDEREAVARLAAQGPPDESVGLEPYALPDVKGARP
ncbi:nitrate reductase molybdenum cofactor assembly chaperone [Pengzhenrongella frigida]|uniref:Nitrate reductase molybdenum cofactor assembly chaperone n=2 Tax=Pengzhenrongella frigida TaxID=1259133 RepID=A0A4Q5N474_9MICO|nr:nitrate reductase molybdenum cofactor assembly chaperone [Cellulomonas sp. HLT2-17]